MLIELEDTTFIKGNDIAAIWNKEDTYIQYKYFYKVKFLKSLSVEGTRIERNNIITEFNDNLKKAYNDHRSIVVNPHKEPHVLFQPKHVEEFPNLIVMSGLSKIAEIVTNQSNTYFTFIEIGEGNAPIGLLNTKLQLPIYRVNVQELGWYEPHGTTIRTGTLFPENVPNCTIKEIGGFDLAEDPSTMCWRVVIEDASKYLIHVVNESYVSISHVHTLK